MLAESGPELSTPAERLTERITSRTRVISLSWVQFQTGAVTDLPTVVAAAKKELVRFQLYRELLMGNVIKSPKPFLAAAIAALEK